mmetsp:Transcript_11007/g.33752  ORF Transcript_11007/g.33752 Transcript_11007/m.33752 type:complete len:355 (-) Transcript_11007:732-1796(-)|eukprot:CAMPEP_0198730222 /NCGR_PEP_ID=MMETSP1475-20131203/23479_1 /TAXON_ID= ORGANISM="Unidentified sp., Strain CCMP1999" /NCGR_SAMPLE_ID=MMETSP1475 /ASSEMBLY_ACC=CAM_ASM_001111 /LENGTH=354 /DNA_ID=CAMNT_0044493005 /DNA_START=11 /DNA_END=1075 /DNA_ORIENTATION=-
MAEKTFDYAEHPHRRYNPLKGCWVFCSPHRAKRPWQGGEEKPAPDTRPEYDPDDYLGPGNSRAGGKAKNPDYKDTFVFDNDFMALLPDTPEGSVGDVANGDLFVAQAVKGRCRVICFSPKLNITIAEMDHSSVRKVIDAMTDEYNFLADEPYINHVQIFENRGETMGCSNPHPHGQIWSSNFIPEDPTREFANMEAYEEKYGVGLLEKYVEQEMKNKERLIFHNDSFICVVPFWALWPFESMVISKTKVGSLAEMDDKMKDDLADMYRRITCRYDNLFKCSFPYSMGLRQAPTDGQKRSYCHFYMIFLPPLLRSATVRKFMVGFELLCEGQRDLTAEQAAARLRDLPEIHFRQQ